ncbi:hypothetical protein KXD93_03745 [Mucilaginibacter sp. BJC16-A38]|uniref:hypothetical protein n=1 Tax=Mucilaginibacter phenanthrenivorans TaxID=1234842 RepID=UPI002157A055|nr:hypothetical protein [Mucilaginibacter phenanthrenivorans]MCR8556736.1 hypothetical protein [Mucilaginibacter phenanthrenivorans]
MNILRFISLGAFFIILSNYSFGQSTKKKFSKSDSLFVFNPRLDIKTKRRMLDSAFANNSTAPNFVVIVATNQITGVTKEICTEAPFVEGGVDRNKGKEKSQNYKSQHFYFNTKPALDNIGFYEYSYSELLEYGQNKDVRKIVTEVLKSNKEIELNFQGPRKQQFMFAHILFNNGIMSIRGDIAGNIMTLTKIK